MRVSVDDKLEAKRPPPKICKKDDSPEQGWRLGGRIG